MSRHFFSLSTFFSAAVLALSLCSCDDISEVDDALAKENVPSTAAPKIEKISIATDTMDHAVTRAEFGQVIRIQGTNLGNVRSLRFNDVETPLSEVYAKYDVIMAPVPRQLPERVTNRVYLTTALGADTTYLFIDIPELHIIGLKNEFCQPGDTTVLTGHDFDLYGITAEEADIRIGGRPCSIIDASETEVKLQIPGNAQLGTPMTVQGSKMDEPVSVPYGDLGVAQLFDYNDYPGSGNFTHSSQYPSLPKDFLYDETIITKDDPDPIAPGMKYVRFKGDVSAWGWMVMWAGNISLPAEVVADPSQYELRFEMNNHPNYPFNSQTRVVFGNYVWEPAASGVPVNTQGLWQTIRIPLKTPDGSGNLLIPFGLDPALKFSFNFVFSPSAQQHFDVAFCNFRFAKPL